VVDDQTGDETSYSISLLVIPGDIALSDTEKAEALADSLEAQFQPIMIPLVPAVIEMVDVELMSAVVEIVDVELMSYFLTPVSAPQCNQP
jgi:hypothetical protein